MVEYIHMRKGFEPGQYQFDEQKNLAADRAAFETLINEARNTNIYEEKTTKRELVKDLVAHGLVDRPYIIKLLQDQGVSREKINEWQERILTTADIVDEFVPLSAPEEKAAEADQPETPKIDFGDIEVDKAKMPEIIQVADMILPTDDEPKIVLGEGEFREAGKIPRTAMLINLLTENGIDPADCKILSGINDPNVVRQESYHLFLVGPIEKMIYICDEEGNATYVMHQIAEDYDDLRKLIALKKSELKVMGKMVDMIIWSTREDWEEKILEALTKESPITGQIKNWEEFTKRIKEKVREAKENQKEKGRFLNFETLKAEVKAAGITANEKDYRQKQKKHPNWPSAPDVHYREWTNWPEFFGREKTEFVDFQTLKQQISEAGIQTRDQYLEEKRNHPTWPSNPYEYYNEWVNWPDFLKREDKFLDFTALKDAVQQAKIQTYLQYFEEQKKHSDWPSHPERQYKEWTNWKDFLNKEKIMH